MAPDGGEAALDGGGRAHLLPVLGREVVEGRQAVPALDPAGDCLLATWRRGPGRRGRRPPRRWPWSRQSRFLSDIPEMTLGRGLQALGQLVEQVGAVVHPAALLGDVIIARIRRPHVTPSPRFSSGSTKRCQGQCSKTANRATQHNDGMSLLAMSHSSNQATATAALPPKAEFRAPASAFQSFPSASSQ